MRRWRNEDEEEDEGEDSWDEDDTDWDPDEESNGIGPTVACRYCRREIYEDAVRCPHCGNYLSQEDAGNEGKPLWIIVGTLLCLGAMLWWALMG